MNLDKDQGIQYDEMVKEFIRKDSTIVFGNLSVEHAKFIIESFIESAENSIEILSGACFSAFYAKNDFYKKLEVAAKKINIPGKIRIITIGDKNYQDIKQNLSRINDNVKKDVISYFPCVYKPEYENKSKTSHFIVVDGKRYREEEPHCTAGMPELVKASVCCNGKEKAGVLAGTFDIIWKNLESTTANA